MGPRNVKYCTWQLFAKPADRKPGDKTWQLHHASHSRIISSTCPASTYNISKRQCSKVSAVYMVAATCRPIPTLHHLGTIDLPTSQEVKVLSTMKMHATVSHRESLPRSKVPSTCPAASRCRPLARAVTTFMFEFKSQVTNPATRAGYTLCPDLQEMRLHVIRLHDAR